MNSKINSVSKVVAVPPPTLDSKTWYLSWLVGAVLLLGAVLQLLNFQDFVDSLSEQGLHSPNYWAGAVVFAELWAAAGFFKISLSPLFRKCSNFLAVAVGGFWFYESIKAVADGLGNFGVPNFFGKYAVQNLGWWTIIESTIFLFVVLYILEKSGQGQAGRPKIVTKVTRTRGKKEVV